MSLSDCPDCNAEPGQLHDPGCDVERCPRCGGQLLSCDCIYDAELDARRLPWTGEWPGDAECREFGWLTPAGEPDLNRLAAEGVWDADAGRFRKPDQGS